MKNSSLENIPEELRAVLESLSSRIAALEREVAELRGVSPLPEAEAGAAGAGSGSEETIDLSLDDITVPATVAETVTSTAPEPVEMPVEFPEPIAETAPEPVDVPAEENVPRTEETLFGEIEVEDMPRKGRHGKKAAGGAVMDVMAEKDAWLHDIPGPEVKSLRSAIGLGDQLLYIRRLFRGDSALYQYAIDKLNSMSTLKEAVTYVSENFPEWDPDSEDGYRFMMSVRRKIRK